MNRIDEAFASAGVAVHAVVREGNPADEILAEVKEQHADLVIMRTHGRSGLGRAVLGSVTERVLKAGIVPLVLLRPGGRRVSHLRRLLVPVDGSPGGAVALGVATGLAKATGAALRLLEVVVPIPTYLYATPMGGAMYVDPAWETEAEAAAQTYIDSVTARLRAAGMDATGTAVVGASVADKIIKAAEEQPAELIVMSSEALTGAARALLGSVSDAVVRTSHCPVLVIHRPPAVSETANTAASLSTVKPGQQRRRFTLTAGAGALPVHPAGGVLSPAARTSPAFIGPRRRRAPRDASCLPGRCPEKLSRLGSLCSQRGVERGAHCDAHHRRPATQRPSG